MRKVIRYDAPVPGGVLTIRLVLPQLVCVGIDPTFGPSVWIEASDPTDPESTRETFDVQYRTVATGVPFPSDERWHHVGSAIASSGAVHVYERRDVVRD